MKEVRDEAVLEVQIWINATYSEELLASDYGLVAETGKTSWDTVNGLIIGLQVELGLPTYSLSPNFGEATLAALIAHGNISEGVNDENANINQILKGGCIATGYYPGYFDGEFDQYLTSAIKELQNNIGITEDGIVTPKVFKALLTMNAYVLLPGGSSEVREFQQWMNGMYDDNIQFYYYPCDGLYSRGCQEAVVFGIQFECGLGIDANGWFGPTTQQRLKERGLRSVGDSDENSEGYFVHLFKGAFLCNNLESYIDFDGFFDMYLMNEVTKFQEFACLDENGEADFATWAELLVSTGDANRKTEALDCSIEKVDSTRAEMFSLDGYKSIGRYLTNDGGILDKVLEQYEIDAIFDNNMSIFPIYQTYHNSKDHFTYDNGKSDMEDAIDIAKNTFKIPEGTTIYFPVDFDALEEQVNTIILNYFRGLQDVQIEQGNLYEIGVYGARNTCSIISNEGIAKYSFVSGMSIGFSGNLGYALPENWAFNQIYEDAILGIDHDVMSGRDTGFSQQETVIHNESWCLSGAKYGHSGGNFEDSTYYGYNAPGGEQIMLFSTMGLSAAFEVYSTKGRWFMLVDENKNFFFVPEEDITIKEDPVIYYTLTGETTHFETGIGRRLLPNAGGGSNVVLSPEEAVSLGNTGLSRTREGYDELVLELHPELSYSIHGFEGGNYYCIKDKNNNISIIHLDY